MNSDLGKSIIFIGLLIIIVGVFVYFFGDKLRFIGNLPGDIRIERENFKIYFPITTMLLLSVILNLILKLFRYLQQ